MNDLEKAKLVIAALRVLVRMIEKLNADHLDEDVVLNAKLALGATMMEFEDMIGRFS